MKVSVRSIGNSSGIVLPKEVLSRMRISKGDDVYLTETSDGGYKIVPYDEEFSRQLEMAEQIMREDRDILKALSK